MVKGIGASSGIAVGKAFVTSSLEFSVPDKLVDVTELAHEFEKLYEGIQLSKTELEVIKQDIRSLIGEQESHIFDAHLAILEDPVFMHEIEDIITRQYKAAEVAVKEAIDKFVSMFDLLDDEYMRERAADIRDVGGRLLKHLLGDWEESNPPEDHPYILVARELSPSQLAHIDPARVLGLVTLLGGATSHVAIMARAMGIPFVLGLEGRLDVPIQTGDLLILDGENGDVIVNPTPELLHEFEERRERLLEARRRLLEIVDVPPITRDGQTLRLLANISSIKELEQALGNGAEGVGLFRTEFIYMDRATSPSEEEQYTIYRTACEKLGGRDMTIRTLDIGGDKSPSFIYLPQEENPALGYRAIRVTLDRQDLLKTQLKAILRASVHGAVKIMYPMISSVTEVRRANAVLEQAKEELRAQHVPFREDIPVGIMIEVPAAAVIADLLAREVDFFSIGTNDLVQYVLAVDRMNESIAHLYEPYHPAVLRLLQITVEAAIRAGIPVSVCGELAGDVRALPIWLGLGVRDLSMAAGAILPIKQGLIRSEEAACRSLFQHAIHLPAEEVRQLVDRYFELQPKS
jgi:phosphotransferase system enzyme I (PtsI)